MRRGRNSTRAKKIHLTSCAPVKIVVPDKVSRRSDWAHSQHHFEIYKLVENKIPQDDTLEPFSCFLCASPETMLKVQICWKYESFSSRGAQINLYQGVNMLDFSSAHETNESEMTNLQEWGCGKRRFHLPVFARRKPKEALGKLQAIS